MMGAAAAFAVALAGLAVGRRAERRQRAGSPASAIAIEAPEDPALTPTTGELPVVSSGRRGPGGAPRRGGAAHGRAPAGTEAGVVTGPRSLTPGRGSRPRAGRRAADRSQRPG